MASSTHQEEVVLHTYYRSSCSARLRIALATKNIEYKPIYVNIKDGFHLHPEYTAINASRTVPTLHLGALKITQSIAALELLEEAFPHSKHMLPPPSDPAGRAQVRALVNIIASDVQPPTNMKVLKRIGALGQDTRAVGAGLHGRGVGGVRGDCASDGGDVLVWRRGDVGGCGACARGLECRAVWAGFGGVSVYDEGLCAFEWVGGVWEESLAGAGGLSGGVEVDGDRKFGGLKRYDIDDED